MTKNTKHVIDEKRYVHAEKFFRTHPEVSANKYQKDNMGTKWSMRRQSFITLIYILQIKYNIVIIIISKEKINIVKRKK